MNQPMTLSITDVQNTDIEMQSVQSTSIPLCQSVREFLKQHFMQFSQPPADFYELILAEIEAPMLEIVLQYVGQNQSRAARILAMSRGNLRKKMQRYGMLPQSKKSKK